ncbi:Pentatricopeptide repeat-containing protein [Camellia lanceoleosa]|uniref:Pentatricopeptide repeat-containing protein n=1 Tax=Camellia lanceoleosa TaxID=1840588 RepID=A0ACC0FZA3_9ERIC|nr:Pentatricopeptide repeat-containing protein [Camellia lanceoleosa]
MVSGFCAMDLPHEVENVMEEMRDLVVKSSVFEFRSVIYMYGKLDLFDDMKRCVVQKEIEGFILHTVCSIMVLSSFGAHGELSEMVLWLQMMKSPGVAFSIHTYNSMLNSCPTIMTKLQELKTVPISIQEPMENLRCDEVGREAAVKVLRLESGGSDRG